MEPAHRRFDVPCEGCGAQWQPDPVAGGNILDHLAGCPLIAAEDAAIARAEASG